MYPDPDHPSMIEYRRLFFTTMVLAQHNSNKKNHIQIEYFIYFLFSHVCPYVVYCT